jgi:peptidyl-prolyl cis-trans isomerase A (cyclophilin A)
MTISAIARTSALTLCAVLIPLAGAQTRISIETEAGVIEAVLDDQKAPLTAANFLKYVDAGQYTGASFFRTVRTKPDNQPGSPVKIDVIQAEVAPEFRRSSFPPVPIERTKDTGLKHVDGALSMPRNAPDSATSGFSICIGDQAEMDFGGRRNPDGQGFAVFGRVTSGMDIVRKIHDSPAGPSGAKGGVTAGDQRLTPPVKILSIRRK